jgi:hypothetical protein
MENTNLYEKENTTIEKSYNFMYDDDAICRIVFDTDSK